MIDLVAHEISMKQRLNIWCVKEVGTDIELLPTKVYNLVSLALSQLGLSTDIIIREIGVAVHNLLMK